jgi:hypothetical protein
VAVLYDVVQLTIRRNAERLSGCTEFRRDVQGYKYKRITQERTMAMDSVSVYTYVCIGLVGSVILGMIIFAWIVLRKFRPIPRQ